MPLNESDDLDGSWKLGLDDFLPQLMLLLFPHSYAEIDWSRAYRPLNAELQAILPADETATRRFADALYQVFRRDGGELWIVLHFEVQNQPDPGLPKRMFVYNYRCFERYGAEVFGYAILGDRNPDYRPGPYVSRLGKCGLVYEYEVAKLLDHPIEDLEASDNPAALLLLAHHYTLRSKRRQTRRRGFKLHLTRLLFRKGYRLEQANSLFKVIDRMLRLEPEQAIIFTREVVVLREEPDMSDYVHTFEWVFTHLGREEGLEQGKKIGVEQGKKIGAEQGQKRLLRAQLVRRFGKLPAWAEARLERAESETVERWSLQLLDAGSLEAVFS